MDDLSGLVHNSAHISELLAAVLEHVHNRNLLLSEGDTVCLNLKARLLKEEKETKYSVKKRQPREYKSITIYLM